MRHLGGRYAAEARDKRTNERTDRQSDRQMKIFLLFYVCHFAMGLTHCYKTTVF